MPIRRVTTHMAALLLLVVWLATWANGSGLAKPVPHRELAQADRSQIALLTDLRQEVAVSRHEAWHWQGLAGRGLSPTSYSERRTANPAYLRWQVRLWTARRLVSAHYVRQLLSDRGYLPPVRARQLGRVMAALSYGWTGTQWRCLDDLWGHRESGWYVRSANPTSQAYGIPQANPGDKMASAGTNWLLSAYTQIKWGLKYIADHRPQFATPCQAIAWHNIYHSY